MQEMVRDWRVGQCNHCCVQVGLGEQSGTAGLGGIWIQPPGIGLRPAIGEQLGTEEDAETAGHLAKKECPVVGLQSVVGSWPVPEECIVAQWQPEIEGYPVAEWLPDIEELAGTEE